MFFNDYKHLKRWLNILFILPPVGLAIFGGITKNEILFAVGALWVVYNLVHYFMICSMLIHMYCEIFNIDWVTKSMMEDSIDYYQAGSEYNYVHTEPGWRRDKVWLHIMVSKYELDMLKEIEKNGNNRHDLIGDLIIQAHKAGALRGEDSV